MSNKYINKIFTLFFLLLVSFIFTTKTFASPIVIDMSFQLDHIDWINIQNNQIWIDKDSPAAAIGRYNTYPLTSGPEYNSATWGNAWPVYINGYGGWFPQYPYQPACSPIDLSNCNPDPGAVAACPNAYNCGSDENYPDPFIMCPQIYCGGDLRNISSSSFHFNLATVGINLPNNVVLTNVEWLQMRDSYYVEVNPNASNNYLTRIYVADTENGPTNWSIRLTYEPACTPSCAGKCGGGADGCGGACWDACGGGQVCSGTTCVAPSPVPTCAPNCINKCGGEANGCGGVCPNSCALNQACLAGGVCCTPQCTSKCGGVADSCGGTCSTACPGDIQVSGSFKEDLSGSVQSCSTGHTYVNNTPLKDYISLQNPANKTLTCTSTDTTYSCNVKFSTSDDPTANFTLAQTQPDYTLHWNCPNGNTTTTLSAGQTLTNDIYFTLENQNWFKLKDLSFNSATTKLNLPSSIIPYDATDDGSSNVIIGDAGIVTGKSTLDLTNLTGTKLSQYGNKIEHYSNQKVFGDLRSIISYTQNKNKNKTIANLSEIPANYPAYKTFIINGNVTINATAVNNFKDKNLFLIVKGIVNFSTDLSGTFNPANSNIVLAAKEIHFYTDAGTPATGSIKDARGIFMAETIDTGIDNSNGLKITGNLISLNNNPLQNSRIAGTNQKPGVYVVGDPQLYLNLLGTLSNYSYDWTQN